MKHFRLVSALLASLSLSPAVAGELKGRILAGEKPAKGVTVSAIPYEAPFDAARREARRLPAPKALAETTTGPDGAFALSVPADPADPARSFEVRIAGGGVVATLLDGAFESAETEDLGELVLPKAEKLAGRVVDASGNAVAGAEVTLLGGFDRFGDGARLLRAPRKAGTGEDGTFRFDDASAEGNALSVEKGGFAPARTTNVKAGVLGKPVPLFSGARLAGSLKRSDRKAAAGALVRFEGAAVTRWVETGPDGAFVLEQVPAGRGTLVADGGEAGWAELVDPRPPAVSLTLAPPAALEGRVVDAKSGRPVPRVRLEVRTGNGLRVTRSLPDGRYRVKGLAPHSARVRADEPRYVPYEKDAGRLLPGETKKLDLSLTPGATLAGRVVDEDGSPVAGAKGRLERGGETGIRALLREMRAGERPAFRSAADGTFRATRLAPGDNQRLSVVHADYERTTVGGISLAPGATRSQVTVLLRRGASLGGVVTDADGAPLGGAEAELATSAGFRGGRGGMTAAVSIAGGPLSRPRTTTGPDGTFRFRGLSPGDYTLVVRKPGYATERVDPVKLATAVDHEPLAVRLSRGASISGAVRTKGGSGAEGWFVRASAPGRGGIALLAFGPGEPTGPDGAFLLEGLKAGATYDLQALGGAGLGPQKKGVVAPSDGVEIVVSGSGRVQGVALDGLSGQPLTDFTVSYEPERSGGGGGFAFRFANRAAGQRLTGIGEKRQVHADDGSFVLEDVPAGTWQIVVESKGYQTGRVGGVAVEEGATRANVEVKLAHGAALAGRVTDARTGTPVPDAAVSAQPPSASGGMPFILDTGEEDLTTDADGRFTVDGIAPGKYRVTARHADYAESSEVVDVAAKGGFAELKLSAGGAIAGVVVSATRQPVPGANVTLAASGDAGFGRGLGGAFGGTQGTVTDAGGAFRFDHLGSGRFGVTASLRGQSSAPAEVVLQPGESRGDVAVVISAGAAIKGIVSGLSEAERGGVNVTASGPEAFFSSTRTAPDGTFEIDGAPAGAITLRATAGDMTGSTRTATKQVPIADGQPEVQVELVFDPGYSISGRVLKGGQPLAGAFVNVNLQGGGGRSGSARADDLGAYRIEGLAAGTYAVTASSGVLSGSSRRETVAVSGDANLDLVFPSARLGGTVAESGSHQPLADAVVEITSADPGSGLRQINTDSNGRFSVSDLDPKSFTLTVRKADYQFEKRDVVAAEQGTDELVFELMRGEGIGIQARDGIYSMPLRGLVARATDSQGVPVFAGSVTLDGNGRGEIPSLKPGGYSLVVESSGYAARRLDGITVPSSTIQVSLTPGGSVEIHAGKETLAKGTARATLLTAAGPPYPVSIFSPDGRFAISAPVRTLPNVAPGSYLLVVEGGATKGFQVAEGGTAVVELP